MSPVSPLPAVLAFLLAYACAWLLARRFPPDAADHRYVALDGLRGYLAFAVFLHHGAIWYFYLRQGVWEVPPSRLYTHFGQTGVALFFMITGFLFFSKLLDGRARPIDWLRLYVSRVLRLAPLYFFVIALLVLVVAIVSDFTLREPIMSVMRKIIYWLSFTVLGGPDINGVARTTLILAGVTWSLPYEWMFYLVLPLLFLLRGGWPGWPWLLLGLAAIGVSIIRHPPLEPFPLFLGGIAAALLVRWPTFVRLCRGPLATIVAIACAAAAIAGYGTVYHVVPTLLLSATFAIICAGNSLFGLLRLPASRLLGEISYKHLSAAWAAALLHLQAGIGNGVRHRPADPRPLADRAGAGPRADRPVIPHLHLHRGAGNETDESHGRLVASGWRVTHNAQTSWAIAATFAT